MGTHCYIALEHFDGTITYIYCNFDGYPSYVGKRLYTYYSTREKIETLVQKGSIASLVLPIDDMEYMNPAETWIAEERFVFETKFFQSMNLSYYY